jgi:DNA-binding response OmpR family regulator
MRLSVALVTPSPELEGLDTLLTAGEYDLLVIDSMDRAYSEIRELQPDVVVLGLEFDERAACQLLSMLKLDTATSHIPVLTSPGPAVASLLDRDLQSPNRLETSPSVSCSMN